MSCLNCIGLEERKEMRESKDGNKTIKIRFWCSMWEKVIGRIDKGCINHITKKEYDKKGLINGYDTGYSSLGL